MKKKTSKKQFINEYSELIIQTIRDLDPDSLKKIVDVIWLAYKGDKTIFFVGNGGSASTASHMAADIGKNTVVNYKDVNEKRLKTVSLCDNVSWITAIGNDLAYEDIFVEQLKNFAQSGDLLVIISGSGNSLNIVKTAMWARKNGLHSIGILGFDGGYVKDLLEFPYIVNCSDYGIVESVHSYIHHFLVESLKKRKKEEKT